MSDPIRTDFEHDIKLANILRNNYTEVQYLPETKDEMAAIQLDQPLNPHGGTVYFDHEKDDFEEDFIRFAVEAWRLWPEIQARLGAQI